METLVGLDLPPGLSSNGTRYNNRNRWLDGSLVRFLEGAIRPVGGWLINRTAEGADLHIVGTPRGSLGWRDNDSAAWLGVGTTGPDSRLYVLHDGTLTDITPVGLVDGAVDGGFASGGVYGGGRVYGGGSVYGGFTLSSVILAADTWSLDNFGEILLACLTSDGTIYESTPNAVAVAVTNAPTDCRGIVVTNERFIFALGAGGDPRLVAWCSQEARTVWTPAVGNSAGDFPLQTNGRLVAGAATARETLLWTDADLWGASYIGGTLIYRFDQRGDNCGLIGPNAFAIVGGNTVYWMGDGRFFQYAGAVREIPCPVSEAVFGNLSQTQRAKIQAVPMAFGEVWWFYPSNDQSGTENDRYVAYQPATGLWMTGALARASGIGAGVFTNPQLWTSDGFLFTHESGIDHGGEIPFLETGPLEIADGERTVLLQKLYADELVIGSLTVKAFSAFNPTDVETETTPQALTAPTDMRVSGRQFRLRFEENLGGVALADGSYVADGAILAGAGSLGVDWRLGRMRVGVIQGGRR